MSVVGIDGHTYLWKLKGNRFAVFCLIRNDIISHIFADFGDKWGRLALESLKDLACRRSRKTEEGGVLEKSPPFILTVVEH
jgi:hypothetical protein